MEEIKFCTTPDDGTRNMSVRGIECIVKSSTVGSTLNSGGDNDIINNFGDNSTYSVAVVKLTPARLQLKITP